MKQILIALTFSLCSFAASAQSFEGEVIYHTTFKSKMANISDEKFNEMAGNTLKYYMKGGDYRSDCSGTLMTWQIYINRDNKLYDKFNNYDSIYWHDGAIQKDSILSVQLSKGVTEILGYKCDELILNCKSGVQKYYFTAKFAIDSKLYAKQLYQNWHAYLKIAKAMPLEMIIDNAQETVNMIATSVTPMKLDDTMFSLPANATLVPSTY